MKLRWRFNTLGVIVYMALVGWVLFASITLLMNAMSGTGLLSWRPIVGILVGLLGLAGIGWGRIESDDDDREA